MSTGVYTTCDMCGKTVTGNKSKWGRFYIDPLTCSADAIDLCPKCASKVEQFIRGWKKEESDERQD